MSRQVGGFDLRMRQPLAVRRPQPAVVAPLHLLYRGLAPERAAAAVAQGAPAEVNHVGLAVLRLDEVAVAGALQLDVGSVARSQNVRVGVKLVRAVELARA